MFRPNTYLVKIGSNSMIKNIVVVKHFKHIDQYAIVVHMFDCFCFIAWPHPFPGRLHRQQKPPNPCPLNSLFEVHQLQGVQ